MDYAVSDEPEYFYALDESIRFGPGRWRRLLNRINGLRCRIWGHDYGAYGTGDRFFNYYHCRRCWYTKTTHRVTGTAVFRG